MRQDLQEDDSKKKWQGRNIGREKGRRKKGLGRDYEKRETLIKRKGGWKTQRIDSHMGTVRQECFNLKCLELVLFQIDI